MKLKFSVHRKSTSHLEETFRKRIREFNETKLGKLSFPIAFAAKKGNTLIAGAHGFAIGDAFHIVDLWVKDDYRKQGVGRNILSKIDAEARRRKLRKIFVDTYDFQAEGFYLKNGYRVFGRIKDCLLGHERIFLRKNFR